MSGRSAALPRSARLTGKAQFDRVFALRTTRNSRYFRLNLADNGLDNARLGMAVSRRVDKRAVQRNRLRRQVRESFRLAWPGLPALDIVVTARPDAAQAERSLVWADLQALWAALAAR
jgi:ribonuclease P protein component